MEQGRLKQEIIFIADKLEQRYVMEDLLLILGGILDGIS